MVGDGMVGWLFTALVDHISIIEIRFLWCISVLSEHNQLLFNSYIIWHCLSQWSFGVLLWEIITRGIVPYSNIDQRHQLHHLIQGGRLDKPRHCPDAMWVNSRSSAVLNTYAYTYILFTFHIDTNTNLYIYTLIYVYGSYSCLYIYFFLNAFPHISDQLKSSMTYMHCMSPQRHICHPSKCHITYTVTGIYTIYIYITTDSVSYSLKIYGAGLTYLYTVNAGKFAYLPTRFPQYSWRRPGVTYPAWHTHIATLCSVLEY